MLKKNSFLIIFLLFINYINYLYCNIVLPLDILPRENYKLLYDINSPEDIIDKENRISFFTTYEIGLPLQKVPLIIKAKKNFYMITSIYPFPNTTITNDFKKFNFSKKFFETYDFYNETKSKSCIINWCRESEYYTSEECCSVNDTILYYQDVNLTKKINININFEMMRNVEDNITGEIGLNIYDEVGRFYNTFLGILKKNKLINNYNWYFDFDSRDNQKGRLVVGSLPHEDYPDSFSEKDLLYTKSNQLSRSTFMEMKFDKVYIINDDKTINFNVDAELRYDSKIIIADYEYKKNLLSKIDDLIKEQKCKEGNIRDFEYYHFMTFYYCKKDKDIKKKLNEIITPIYFFSKDFNKTFEITNNEILLEKDGYIYIQMLFNEIVGKWSLGTVFTLNHKFIFNQEEKQIGYYIKLKEEKIDPKDYIVIIQISVFILLAIILIFLGILIGKKLNKSRKKRANELLDDDYDYNVDGKKENESNIINNEKLEIGNIN